MSLNSPLLKLDDNAISDAGVWGSGAARHLRTIRHLSLSSNPIGSDGVGRPGQIRTPLPRRKNRPGSQYSARCHWDHGLLVLQNYSSPRSLRLSHNRISTPAIAALSASPNLTNLTVLDLDAAEIGEEGAKALAGSPHLNQIRTLSLAANGIRHFGLKALLTSSSLGNLRDLDLHGNLVLNLGVEILANSLRLGSSLG